MANQRPPTIDPQAAARWQQLPASVSPWLHEEVGSRMQERLEWITLKPARWAHWQPVRGGLQTHTLLTKRYPKAQCFVTESNGSYTKFATQSIAKPWWNPSAWSGPGTRFESPAEASVQMVWANMSLHMAADPQQLMGQWHRALAVEGFVMFSCLGPDTLRELRDLYQSLGWPAPSHEFTDMHDWGDMLVAAGFAEPVMDMERITLTFETPERLLEELRGLGRNLHPQRFAGLRGRQWLDNLRQALKARPMQLTFEIIYGHAFKPQPRLSVKPETVLSLAQMRESLSRPKTYPSLP